MSKGQRLADRTARARIAAQERARRAQRRRLAVTAGCAAIVLIAVAIFAGIRLAAGPGPAGPRVADAGIAREVASVPAADFNAAGRGGAAGLQALTGPPLRSAGKPEVPYIGAEWCPYCAAERWALAAALSRFGSFSGLHFIRSSASDSFAGTPTLSFYRSRYASRYLAFVPVEWYGEHPGRTATGYALLQPPTPAQAALFRRYSGGSFPFADLGGRFAVHGAQYSPGLLSGLSWAEVAAGMRDPRSPAGRGIDGAANILTAALCHLTHGQPGGVCASAGVRAAAHG